ncbi:hypothetical protein ES708_13769 [subsurface metagenome]
MVPRWFPLSINQELVVGGYTIVLTTDVPCHLWLFWTDKVPWVHRTSTIERGLAVPWHSYWCFVVWHLIAQDEPGDTTTHTFQWPGWVNCQTKYFRFHGDIAGKTSPSDSPIFRKHYAMPDTEEHYFNSDADDGYMIVANKADWATVRAVTHADATRSAYTFMRATCRADLWGTDRAYLFFPTHTIPPGSTVVGAKLKFWPYVKGEGDAGYQTLYVTRAIGSKPMDTWDWPAQTLEVDIGGEIAYANIDLNEYNTITLNPTGLTFVIPGDWTKLCIRNRSDVKNLEPSGVNYTSWRSHEAGAAQEPWLYVTFY